MVLLITYPFISEHFRNNSSKSSPPVSQSLKRIRDATVLSTHNKTVAITLLGRQCVLIVILVLSPVILADKPERNVISLSLSLSLSVCMRRELSRCRPGRRRQRS